MDKKEEKEEEHDIWLNACEYLKTGLKVLILFNSLNDALF